jgi:hypothetical protein
MIDPYYQNVVLLLDFEDYAGGDILINGAYDPVPISTANRLTVTNQKSRFGKQSLFCSTSNAYAYGNHSNFALASVDFTFECWINLSSFPSTYAGIFSNGYSSSYYLMRIMADQTIQFIRWSDSNDSISILSSTSLTLETWYHVAVSKIGNIGYLFLDGVLQDSGEYNYSITPYPYFYLNRDLTNSWGVNGYIDNVRLTTNIARYTENFTPPTEPFISERVTTLSKVSMTTPLVCPIDVKTAAPHEPIWFKYSDESLSPYSLSGIVTVKYRPVQRKVVLLNELTGALAGETISDPVSGKYTFTNVPYGKYTVLVIDHTGKHRTVMSSNLSPSL